MSNFAPYCCLAMSSNTSRVSRAVSWLRERPWLPLLNVGLLALVLSALLTWAFTEGTPGQDPGLSSFSFIVAGAAAVGTLAGWRAQIDPLSDRPALVQRFVSVGEIGGGTSLVGALLALVVWCCTWIDWRLFASAVVVIAGAYLIYELAIGKQAAVAALLQALALCIGVAVTVALSKVFFESEGASVERPPSSQAVSSGRLELRQPPNWQPVSTGPLLPGLNLTNQLALAPTDTDGTLLVGVSTMARAPTLLQREFASRLDPLPARDDQVDLEAMSAYRYADLKVRGLEGSMTMLVVPSNIGAITLVCYAESASDDVFVRQCERVANTVRLTSGEVLPISPDRSFSEHVTKVLTALGHDQKSAQAVLETATSPGGTAAAAEEVSAAYRRAALALAETNPESSVDAQHSQRIVAALRELEDDYLRVATAAKHEDRNAYNESASPIRKDLNHLEAARRDLAREGYELK